MNILPHRLNELLKAAALGAFAVLLAAPAGMATAQSFPSYPLLTGRSGVPPNILFILDDSGSMRSLSMGRTNSDGSDYSVYAPDDNRYNSNGLDDSPKDRSYVNNSIYYNPTPQGGSDYLPWMNADGTRKANASVTAVSPSVVGLGNEGVTTSGTRSLVDDPDGVFYIPKAGIANPGTDPANYTRYWVANVSGTARVVRGGADQRNTLYTYPIPTISGRGDTYTIYNINISQAPTQLRFELSGGNGDAGMDVYRPNRSQPWCSLDTSNGNSEICVLDKKDVLLGNWTVAIYSTTKNQIKGAVLNVVAVQPTLIQETPTGRSQADELRNIANWYQYHRTRIKVAKAGASEAFGQLDETYRIGFDSIWNRAKGSLYDGTTSGNKPTYPIPVQTDKGLFKGSNRTAWFDYLQSSDANSGTPLHGALTRAGKYYSSYGKGTSEDPWGTGSTSDRPLACRASYAILTTDGFWNSSSGFSSDVGDADGDKVSYTLADVAMYYYRNDLRSDINDNVPADRAGRRNQRMTTFGVSIGLGGTLSGPPNAPPTVWPDPWPTSAGGYYWSTESARRIDDLWHAAVNTDGAFVVANQTSGFVEAIQEAFKSIDGRQASGSNLASNGPQVTAGSYKYSAIYHSSEWWGDLRAFPRNVSTDSYSDVPTWRLSDAVNTDSGFVTRPVLNTYGGSSGLFRTLHASDTTFARSGIAIADNLNYLVGVRAKEDGVTFRKRKLSPIGDIVNSSPVYVNDNGYLFVGANDGMLHGINSANGKVAFSYVPAGINMTWMANLSNPDYEHRFFVDGQIGFSKITKASRKNYLVAALGRGGKGVFALDVTDPTGMTKSQVLWDGSFQSGGDINMGYVLGNPLVRTTNSGNVVALVPNGIDSELGLATLFVYDMARGTATKLFAGTELGNGLMVVETADLNGDGKIDLAYGGDLKGNVWRWDFRSTDAPVARLIFKAVGPGGAAQAITGGLTVVREASTGNIFVAFGTGRLITDKDLPWNDPLGRETQSMYGIIDNLAANGSEKIAGARSGTANRYTELKRRTIPYYGKDSLGRDARSFEVYSPLPEGARGWYVDLGIPSPFADYERVVSAPIAVGRALWIDSIWPSQGDGCEAATGNGYMNALDVFTGTNSSTALSSGDGSSGTFSFIDVDANGQGDDRLAGKDYKDGDNSGYVTSVAHGATMGKPDVSDKEVCTQLDDGRVVCIKRTPGGGGSPQRLMWRELVDGKSM